MVVKTPPVGPTKTAIHFLIQWNSGALADYWVEPSPTQTLANLRSGQWASVLDANGGVVWLNGRLIAAIST